MLHAFDPKTIQRMSFEEPAAVQEKQKQERQQQKQERQQQQEKQQQEKPKKKKSAREQLLELENLEEQQLERENALSEQNSKLQQQDATIDGLQRQLELKNELIALLKRERDEAKEAKMQTWTSVRQREPLRRAT